MTASARVLITAFEAYDRWTTNASWLSVMHLTRDLPATPRITTRLYPVDFAQLRERLAADLAADYDVALHLGQAPGSGRIHLEAFGINVGGHTHQLPDEFCPLVTDGPPAYQSALPLAQWAAKLRGAGIPAQVSYHAGTFLCNATLYLSQYLAERNGLRTRSAFIHLPLEPSQILGERTDLAAMPTATVVSGLRLILAEIAGE